MDQAVLHVLGRTELESERNSVDRGTTQSKTFASGLSINELASRIDHTFLKIDESTMLSDLARFVTDTLKFGFRSIVVNPNHVSTIRRHNTDIRICTVVSYPLGCDTTESKIFAIQDAAERGANEVDVVVDLFALRAANFRKIAREALRLTDLAHKNNLVIKLIIETPIMDEEHIRATVRALLPAKADFWKTSTGYGRRPTHLAHVRLLSNLAPEGVKIKASGGIRTLVDVERAIKEGAFVIGSSRSVAILAELETSSP